MSRTFLYLIIYMVLCGCERMEIPTYDEEEDTEEENTIPLPDVDENSVRDGSREAPYIVAHVQTIGEGGLEIDNIWVEGYIVGWISGSHYPQGARFSAQSAGVTNLLLADSIFENDPAHCIPVELPNNTDIRTKLNLQDNPSNLRRHIKLKGNMTSYFSVTGLKKTSIHEWIGISAMEDEKIALSVTELNEDFTHFKIGDSLALKNWNIAASYTPNWQIGGNSSERYVSICHTDTFSNRPFEYWLITPPLNIKRMKSAIFSFTTSYENWDDNSRLDVFIIDDKTPFNLDLFPALNAITAHPEANAPQEWVHSGNISLHSYPGIHYIGFRYKGKSTGKDGTIFHIDNIRLEETEE